MANSIHFEMRALSRRDAILMRKRAVLIQAGLAYYKSHVEDASISITKFDDRPAVKPLHVDHIHAFRVHEASKLPSMTMCEAGKPVVAMKYWDKDYRNGKKGWN